jgi:3-isopropylmalate/(R)-2-methylmalate dehydratase large subunit
VWDLHKVATLPTGQDQIFIGLHLIHEVTSPQAFSMLRESGGTVAFPERSFATVDHIVPTADQRRPFSDPQAELMVATLEKNVAEFGIRYFGISSRKQGVVHIIGPELGLTQPGMTIACGDSHTSTHGAFGSLAFGIGTTEVRDVLESQSLALDPLKVRKIDLSGALDKGVYAKDVILKIIQILGVKGGLGYAYEYGGDGFHRFTMEERMTVCNMSIEGGARIGYFNPDSTTFDYLKGREFVPAGEAYEKAVGFWKSVVSDPDARYDDVVTLKASEIDPVVTWGINPGQSVGIRDNLPKPEQFPADQRKTVEEAFAYMKLKPGKAIYGTPIDVAFIGSCTNARISDLREAAKVLQGRKVSPNVKTFIVPGSQQVKEQAEKEGLHRIFESAGAEWRGAGCSMCLAMNPDKLVGDQMCASSSNRNFIGRQGSPTGRTLLMSPAMVAASAIGGRVSDPRDYL